MLSHTRSSSNEFVAIDDNCMHCKLGNFHSCCLLLMSQISKTCHIETIITKYFHKVKDIHRAMWKLNEDPRVIAENVQSVKIKLRKNRRHPNLTPYICWQGRLACLLHAVRDLNINHFYTPKSPKERGITNV